VRVEALVKSF